MHIRGVSLCLYACALCVCACVCSCMCRYTQKGELFLPLSLPPSLSSSPSLPPPPRHHHPPHPSLPPLLAASHICYAEHRQHQSSPNSSPLARRTRAPLGVPSELFRAPLRSRRPSAHSPLAFSLRPMERAQVSVPLPLHAPAAAQMT